MTCPQIELYYYFMLLIILLSFFTVVIALLVYAIKLPVEKKKQIKTTSLNKSAQTIVHPDRITTPLQDIPSSSRWISNISQKKEEKTIISKIITEKEKMLNETKNNDIQDLKYDDFHSLKPVNNFLIEDASLQQQSQNKDKEPIHSQTLTNDSKDTSPQELEVIQQQWDSWVIPEIDEKRQRMRIEEASNLSSRIISINRKKGWAKFISSEEDKVYYTTLKECTCHDYLKRMKPCKHIYCLALELGIVHNDYQHFQDDYNRLVSGQKAIVESFEENIENIIRNNWITDILTVLNEFDYYSFSDPDIPNQIETYQSILSVLKERGPLLKSEDKTKLFVKLKKQIEAMPYYALKPGFHFNSFNLLHHLNPKYSSCIEKTYNCLANNTEWEEDFGYGEGSGQGLRKYIVKLIACINIINSKYNLSLTFFTYTKTLFEWFRSTETEYYVKYHSTGRNAMMDIVREKVPNEDQITSLLPFLIILPPFIQREYLHFFEYLWESYSKLDDLTAYKLYHMVFQISFYENNKNLSAGEYCLFYMFCETTKQIGYEVFLQNTDNPNSKIEHLKIVISKESKIDGMTPFLLLKNNLWIESYRKYFSLAQFYKKATNIFDYFIKMSSLPQDYYIYILKEFYHEENWRYNITLVKEVKTWDLAITNAKQYKSENQANRIIISTKMKEIYGPEEDFINAQTLIDWDKEPLSKQLILWDSNLEEFRLKNQRKSFYSYTENELTDSLAKHCEMLLTSIKAIKTYPGWLPSRQRPITYFKKYPYLLDKQTYTICTYQISDTTKSPVEINSVEILGTWDEAIEYAIKQPSLPNNCRTFIISYDETDQENVFIYPYIIWDSNNPIKTQELSRDAIKKLLIDNCQLSISTT